MASSRHRNEWRLASAHGDWFVVRGWGVFKDEVPLPVPGLLWSLLRTSDYFSERTLLDLSFEISGVVESLIAGGARLGNLRPRLEDAFRRGIRVLVQPGRQPRATAAGGAGSPAPKPASTREVWCDSDPRPRRKTKTWVAVDLVDEDKPGDQLYISDKQSKTEVRPTTERHLFRVVCPKLMPRPVVRNFDDQPVAGTGCELDIDGQTYRLKTDKTRRIEQAIPQTAEVGDLRIHSLRVEVPAKMEILAEPFCDPVASDPYEYENAGCSRAARPRGAWLAGWSVADAEVRPIAAYPECLR